MNLETLYVSQYWDSPYDKNQSKYAFPKIETLEEYCKETTGSGLFSPITPETESQATRLFKSLNVFSYFQWLLIKEIEETKNTNMAYILDSLVAEKFYLYESIQQKVEEEENNINIIKNANLEKCGYFKSSIVFLKQGLPYLTQFLTLEPQEADTVAWQAYWCPGQTLESSVDSNYLSSYTYIGYLGAYAIIRWAWKYLLWLKDALIPKVNSKNSQLTIIEVPPYLPEIGPRFNLSSAAQIMDSPHWWSLSSCKIFD